MSDGTSDTLFWPGILLIGILIGAVFGVWGTTAVLTSKEKVLVGGVIILDNIPNSTIKYNIEMILKESYPDYYLNPLFNQSWFIPEPIPTLVFENKCSACECECICNKTNFTFDPVNLPIAPIYASGECK